MRPPETPRARLWWRGPALQFTLLGIALFLGDAWFGTPEEDISRVVTVGPERIEQLREQWRMASGRLPDASEEEWLIRQWVEDELLYREAVAIGLDREDPGVCYRLTLNMSFLGLDEDVPGQEGSTGEPPPKALCERARELGLHRGDPVIRRQMAELMRLTLRDGPALLGVGPQEISRQAMQDYLQRHGDRFREPARVRLDQVFLSRARHGDQLEEVADRLLDRLARERISPPSPIEPAGSGLGDPFLPGPPPTISSERDLERVFGKDFARTAMELPEGRWSGPIASGFGLHLVWLHERRPERLRPLEDVEEKVIRGLHRELAEQQLEKALDRLRARWDIRIERSRTT